MARYNTIWAGPDSENMPQVTEALASAALTPGLFVSLDADGEFALAAANEAGQIFLVQDRYFVMQGVDTVIPAGDTAAGLIMLDEQFFNVRIASGINVLKGAALALGAGGAPVLAVAGSRLIGYADEAYNNTTGTTQLVRVRAVAGYRLAA